ncbi:D-tagatose-bisphosphate aldolase, class II, non-catalytic subunit [Ideonella sp. DXS29W]|uniref:D-tagatose-bisphosphate aldolase, class II, non-catalytic subunit n=1 Tax=Ideonella lacteola TaxID=2984193 RepID=A0ABU9BJP0_9BURK
MKALLELVGRHKAGEAVGIYALCSAHPVVLRAGMQEALRTGSPLLVEATSNQVNQFGGYTGMKPADFHAFVMRLADEAGFPRDRLLLGGDHLGPNCWQGESADSAMAKSEALIEQYVEAGFRKIHLDCSMACADDPPVLPEAVVAQRAARLCAVAEKTHARVGGEAPVYVIGTEVPVPGGAHEDLQELAVTRSDAAAQTIASHRDAFGRWGLEAAWPRVIGLVVQPGVEFDHHKVIDYVAPKAKALSAFIEHEPHLIYEAHSTDYQTPAALQALVRDHFAIVKIGPGATFALREALWGLAEIEREWLGDGEGSHLKDVVLGVMQARPQHWQKYYSDPARQRLDLQFSLSDRIRYYWAQPEVREACARMLNRLGDGPLPLTLLSQYLPLQYAAVRDGVLPNAVGALLHEGVGQVLRQYVAACTPETGEAITREPDLALT